MLPALLGGFSAISSLIGGFEARDGAEEQATANFNANIERVANSFKINNARVLLAGKEVSRETALAITKVTAQANQVKGGMKVSEAERGISGVSSDRMKAVAMIQEDEAKDDIVNKAEEQIANLNNGLQDMALQADNQMLQITDNYNNQLANLPSDFEIITNAASAGFQGFTSGNRVQSSIMSFNRLKGG